MKPQERGESRVYLTRKSGIALHLGGTILLVGLFVGAILVFAAGPSIGLEKTDSTTSITTTTRTLPTVTSVSLSTTRLTTTLPPVTSVIVDTLTTTQTQTQTQTLPPVTSVSVSGTTLSTTMEVTITTTPTPPSNVTVSGTIRTNAIGSSPSEIGFVSQANGVSYLGKISGTRYTVNLPNRESYSVTINENLLLGTSSCSAGTLPVFLELGNASITANWSC